MSKEGQARKAQQLANRWITDKINDFVANFKPYLKELTEEEQAVFRKLVGEQLALAYALGYMGKISQPQKSLIYLPGR